MTIGCFALTTLLSLLMSPMIAFAADGPAVQQATVAETTKLKQENENEFSWRSNDASLTLMQADQVVWRFNFGSDLPKPFFDPINLPGMGNLTWNAPPDHPWHHGIWFSWKKINQLNYWEENRETGMSDGRTTWKVIAIEKGEDFSARIEMNLKYHPPEKPPVLTEHRVISITPPDSHGGYQIDWTGTFTAQDQAVVLDRTPLPDEPDGKIFGGYAGLSVRLAKNASLFEVVNSQLPDEQKKEEQPTRMRFKSRAVDCAGSIREVVGGIAILDHPNNLNAPSPWYVIRDTKAPMTYFSPAVIQDSPHKLAAKDSFTLRYRIIVHPGRFDAETLRRHYNRFAGISRQEKK